VTTGFQFSARVYWEDTDAGGVVYYANYLKFMERARSEWLRSLGFGQVALREELGVVFVVRAVEIDYLAPARLDDVLVIDTLLNDTTRTCLTVTQQIRTDNRLAIARVRLVCLAAASVEAGCFKPARIPAILLDTITLP
jgi:acyl-CoA thioester hydrolase